MSNNAIIRKQIIETIDIMSGFFETQLNMLSSDDVGDVRFITRDDSGLIKGFTTKPVYRDIANAYVGEDGAVFNAFGIIRDDPVMFTVEERFDPTPTFSDAGIDAGITGHPMNIVKFATESLNRDTIKMRKMSLDEMYEIYEIVKQVRTQDAPLLIITPDGCGQIQDKRTNRIFVLFG